MLSNVQSSTKPLHVQYKSVPSPLQDPYTSSFRPIPASAGDDVMDMFSLALGVPVKFPLKDDS